jgi:hypothetical protein
MISIDLSDATPCNQTPQPTAPLRDAFDVDSERQAVGGNPIGGRRDGPG